MKFKPSLVFAIVLIAGTSLLVWYSLRSKPDRVLAGKNKVRFQLQWIDQAQFAGFYVAESKGFYNDVGLSVDLVPGAFNVNPIAKVVSRDVDIGMATGDQVLQRSADGLKIKAIGTVFDHSVACFVTLAESGITTTSQLRGRKVAVFPSYDTDNLLRVLLRQAKIPESEVKITGASGNISQLVSKEVDAYGAYLFNEPLELARMGHNVRVLSPEENGVKFYSDTLITTPEYLSENRDLVVKFLRASQKGWEYARAHPEEAVQIMFQLKPQLARDAANIEGQNDMARTVVKNLQLSGTKPIFTMDPSRWRAMAESLSSVNRLPNDFEKRIDEICDYTLVEEAGK
ncbi:ABC transporter substrate-binding protein [Oleiharenicola lentus]|uniref:ABC transporter substrate-binding protein n=1 Tax=Oleiharenicola lentus TaxID=2508720 RepID=UPI003F662D06